MDNQSKTDFLWAIACTKQWMANMFFKLFDQTIQTTTRVSVFFFNKTSCDSILSKKNVLKDGKKEWSI